MSEHYNGSCDCGGVVYQLTGPLRPSIACHCVQCRKISGHYWSATQVSNERFKLINDETLNWYTRSDGSEQGLCRTCGATLFWRLEGQDTVSIGSGTLDGDIPISEEQHIWTEEKGCYYTLPTGVSIRER